MNKYIIKNCPAIYGVFLDGCKKDHYEDGTVLCQDCTDCIMKQIVDYCLDNEKYGDEYYTRPILEKLDIKEVE